MRTLYIKNNNYHRIFHILNKNIYKSNKYTYADIKKAFSKDNYNIATKDENFIYSRFFKECDIEDLETLILVFGLSKSTIKKLYSSLPIRQISGVSKVWDNEFSLKVSTTKLRTRPIPNTLKYILSKRVA